MTKQMLLSACAAAAFVVAGQAGAQTTPAGAAETAPVQNTDNVDTTPADIVVTAQGRAQVLADVPVAISAVNADSLALSGANDIRQLNQLAPSLLVSSTGSEANGSPRIRGIGTVGDNPGLESSVVVFVDGVYRSRAGIGLNELGEIDRIEVLRGPQGTLGGRNSSAGLISIVSLKPAFTFGANGEATYGNYNFVRLAGGVTGPIAGDTLAARLDGVYVKRDGFYRDRTNDTRINDRDRYFLRGQLLFEPTSDVSLRLIGDYTKRNEACCAATYVDRSVNPYIGNLNEPATPLTTGLPNGNNIVNVLRDLGQNLGALNQGYSRNVSVSRGRTYDGQTQDWGVSGQLDWKFGDTNLTSITAYRDYYNAQGSDTDYGTVDILYNANDGNNRRGFRTFTQEVRLNGSLFGDKLDWLIGGFYINEKFRGKSNLRFGSQYGRFATCRIISGGGLATLYAPNSTGCVAPGVGPLTLAAVGGADVANGFVTLDGINDRGSTIDRYNQNMNSFAAFTHNIIHVTSNIDLTLGLRYTTERKRFSATFGNDNTGCVSLQQNLTDEANITAAQIAANPALATRRALAQALIGLGCQGNSTAELNGVSIRDRRSEDQLTGTAILSWKPIDDLLVYGSYSRGYKAGGGTFRMNVALSELPRFTCLPEPGEHHQSGIIIAPTLDYMDKAFLDAKAHGWSKRPIVEMLIPSTVDDSLAPPGQHVASLFCQQFAPELPDGRDWDAEEDAAADTIIDTVEAHAPGFRASILGRQVLSPKGLYRKFGLVGGDIMHGHMSLDQLWSARPVLGNGAYRGPVKGLYMCGAGNHPGGGVTGAPGHNCAKEVLADGGSFRRFSAV